MGLAKQVTSGDGPVMEEIEDGKTVIRGILDSVPELE
jgi:hypothetical protein